MRKHITISVEEYKQLVKAAEANNSSAEFTEMSTRVKLFADFVNRTNYSISREDCGRYLGFEVVKKED